MTLHSAKVFAGMLWVRAAFGFPSSDSNTATCVVQTKPNGIAWPNAGAGDFLWYEVHIGRPFANGAGCGPIEDTLNQATRPRKVSAYSCLDDGSGATNITFGADVPDPQNILIVSALQLAYPMIPFEAQRICLNNGVTAPDDWPTL